MSLSKETSKLSAALIAGPFFFIATLEALLLKHSLLSLWAVLLSLGGLASVWYARKKGFYWAACFLAATLIIWILKKELSVWDLQLSVSFLLSWLITALSMERFDKHYEELSLKQKGPKPFIFSSEETKLKELSQENSSLHQQLIDKDEEMLFLQKELEEAKKLFAKNQELERTLSEFLKRRGRYTRLKPFKAKEEEGSLFDRI